MTLTELRSLRDRVAEAIRGDGSDLCDQPWDTLSDEKRSGWLGDADRAIPVVAEAAARIVEQRDPEKPANYLIRRERLADAITGMMLGDTTTDDDEETTDD